MQAIRHALRYLPVVLLPAAYWLGYLRGHASGYSERASMLAGIGAAVTVGVVWVLAAAMIRTRRADRTRSIALAELERRAFEERQARAKEASGG